MGTDEADIETNRIVVVSLQPLMTDNFRSITCARVMGSYGNKLCVSKASEKYEARNAGSYQKRTRTNRRVQVAGRMY
jgi:hypothetical protein